MSYEAKIGPFVPIVLNFLSALKTCCLSEDKDVTYVANTITALLHSLKSTEGSDISRNHKAMKRSAYVRPF